jgi:hypothetical protein
MLNWTPQTAPSSGEPTCERQSRSAAVRGIREIRAAIHPVVQTPQGISCTFVKPAFSRYRSELPSLPPPREFPCMRRYHGDEWAENAMGSTSTGRGSGKRRM